MDVLTASFEHGSHRLLGQPIDLEIGMELAQLPGDRDVALRVAEPDGRRDVERTSLPAQRSRPRAVSRNPPGDIDPVDEISKETVDEHRIARRLDVAASLHGDER